MKFMRKSKALTVIRKRGRNGGLPCKPDEEEHPIMLAVKALAAFTDATILLIKAVTEADDPNAAFKELEHAGLFKLHHETGANLNAAMREYIDKSTANHPT